MLRGALPRVGVGAALLVVLVLLAGCQPSGPAPAPASAPAQQLQSMPQLRVGFARPAGFDQATGYRISIPLEVGGQEPQLQTIVPAGTAGGYDVISVITYRLDVDSGTEAADRLLSRVNGYSTTVHATAATAPQPTTAAGHPAWSQTVTQPGGPPGGYTYETVYVFDGWFMVQVMCQYDQHSDTIHRGCTDVLRSLDLGLV